MIVRLPALALAVLLTSATLAVSEEHDQLEQDARAPVMCVWMIFHIYQTIGRNCFPEVDREFLSVLNDETKAIEKFIFENSDQTDRDLAEQLRTLGVTSMATDPGICDRSKRNDWLAGYSLSRGYGIAKLRTSVARMLSVPRKPEFNPCV
jgi:hypothetical protein